MNMLLLLNFNFFKNKQIKKGLKIFTKKKIKSFSRKKFNEKVEYIHVKNKICSTLLFLQYELYCENQSFRKIANYFDNNGLMTSIVKLENQLKKNDEFDLIFSDQDENIIPEIKKGTIDAFVSHSEELANFIDFGEQLFNKKDLVAFINYIILLYSFNYKIIKMHKSAEINLVYNYDQKIKTYSYICHLIKNVNLLGQKIMPRNCDKILVFIKQNLERMVD